MNRSTRDDVTVRGVPKAIGAFLIVKQLNTFVIILG